MLRNLEITKVDVVDRGANQQAHMKLFKRAGRRAEMARRLAKGFAALGKAFAPGAEDSPDAGDERAVVGELTEAEAQALQALIARVGRERVLRFVEAVEDPDRETGDEVEPEEMDVAKRYALLGMNAAKLAKQLSAARDEGDAEYGALVEELDRALEGIVKRGIFTEIGKRDGAEELSADPWARIENAAADRMRAEPAIGKAAAIDAVCRAHPDWVRDYERERLG